MRSLTHKKNVQKCTQQMDRYNKANPTQQEAQN